MNEDIIKKLMEDIENQLNANNEKVLNKVEIELMKDFKKRNINYDVNALKSFCVGIEFTLDSFKKEMQEDFITSIMMDKDFRHALERIVSTNIAAIKLIKKRSKSIKDLDWLNNVAPKDPPKKDVKKKKWPWEKF